MMMLLILLILTTPGLSLPPPPPQQQQQQQPPGGPKPFLTLKGECQTREGKIVLFLQTSEPFEGLLYSRDHPTTCQSGGGSGSETETNVLATLTLPLDDPSDPCGLRKVTRRGQPGVVEADVYVQHDPFVQQAVDEQYLVQCWPGEAGARVTYRDREKGQGSRGGGGENVITREVTVTSKFAGRSRQELQVNVPEVIKVLDTSSSSSSTATTLSTTTTTTISTTSTTMAATSRVNKEVGGWMEMVLPDEEDVSKNHFDNVTLIIRLRQSAPNTDSMISSCSASTTVSGEDENEGDEVEGSSSSSVDLADHRGCSLDQSVMRDFAAAFNSRTNIKALRTVLSSSRLFPHLKAKAASRGLKVTVKCIVLVCKNNCPVSKCSRGGNNDKMGRHESAVSIVDKFVLQTEAHLGGVRAAEAEEEEEEEEKAPNLSLAKTDQVREERKDDHVGSKLVKEEVDEVEEALIEQQEEEQTTTKTKTSEGEEGEESLCLSPSKLIVAFAVLLFVLLLALAFACMLWARARSGLAARNNNINNNNNMRRMRKGLMPSGPLPPPMQPSPMQPPMIARSPQPQQPPMRPPTLMMQRRGGRMPYVRVMQ